jgi:soluble lytic murein transglycosylase
VDPELLAIVALVESGGDPSAGSSAGARGLMQVMPATASEIARERGIRDFDADRLTDPGLSIDFGAYYLAQMLRRFGRPSDPDWLESVTLAASAYNGGPNLVSRWVDGLASLPEETQRYRNWVGGMWAERREAQSPTYEAWLAAGGRRLVDPAPVRPDL